MGKQKQQQPVEKDFSKGKNHLMTVNSDHLLQHLLHRSNKTIIPHLQNHIVISLLRKLGYNTVALNRSTKCTIAALQIWSIVAVSVSALFLSTGTMLYRTSMTTEQPTISSTESLFLLQSHNKVQSPEKNEGTMPTTSCKAVSNSLVNTVPAGGIYLV